MNKGFNTLLERFLVFLTITSFMLTIAILLSPFLNNLENEKILINWFTYLVLGLSGILFLFIQQIFVREKIRPYLHIVSCFFYVLFVVILCAICSQLNQPYILIPFLIIQYILEYTLNNLFVFHDHFINECGELKGKELETHLFHNNLSAIDFGAKARIGQGLLIVLPLILFLAIFALLKNGYTVNVFALCLIILFFLSELLIFFLMGIFKNDIFFGFLGFRNYIQNRSALLRSVFAIIFAAVLFATLLSSNHAFISFSYKERPESEIKYEMPETASYEQGQAYDLRKMLEEMYPDEGNFPDWIIDLIFKILKWAAIIILSLAVIIFFLKPFFSAQWKSFWKEGRLIKFLQQVWLEIKEFFKYTFSRRQNNQVYSTVESRKFGEGIKDFLKKAGRSKEKNAEIDRLTKVFMKLIDWGEAKEIKYRANLAPAEYTALISEKLEDEEVKKAAEMTGLLFEKALYDKEVLSGEEEKLFIQSIDKVMKCE